jgi:hypothetical protein
MKREDAVLSMDEEQSNQERELMYDGENQFHRENEIHIDILSTYHARKESSCIK